MPMNSVGHKPAAAKTATAGTTGAKHKDDAAGKSAKTAAEGKHDAAGKADKTHAIGKAPDKAPGTNAASKTNEAGKADNKGKMDAAAKGGKEGQGDTSQQLNDAVGVNSAQGGDAMMQQVIQMLQEILQMLTGGGGQQARSTGGGSASNAGGGNGVGSGANAISNPSSGVTETNTQQKAALDASLAKIAQDQEGATLLAEAQRRGVTIEVGNPGGSNVLGVTQTRNGKSHIIVRNANDIKTIVHELVHASTPEDNDSKEEEGNANVIGDRVASRIAGKQAGNAAQIRQQTAGLYPELGRSNNNASTLQRLGIVA